MLKQSKLKTKDLDINISTIIDKIIQDNSLEIIPITPSSIRIDPFVQLLCQECINYGSSFQCPPYTTCYSKTREIINKYNFHYVVIQREDRFEFKEKLYDKGWSDRRVNHLNSKNWDVVSYWKFHKAVLRLKDTLESHGMNIKAFGSGGGCRFCRKCEVHNKRACTKPELALPSPEASGIDVYGTLLGLGVPIEIPPRRIFTRVGFIFTNNDLELNNPHPIQIRSLNTNHDIMDIILNINKDIPGEFLIKIHPIKSNSVRPDCIDCTENERYICSTKYLPNNELSAYLENKACIVLRFPSQKALGKYLWRWQKWFQRLGFYDCLAFANEPCYLCNDCSKKGCTLVNNKRNRKFGNQELWRCIKYLSLTFNEFDSDPTIGYLVFSYNNLSISGNDDIIK